ncbi:MAG: hypothetical protein U9R17_13070 [Thermodesulfobacteriota bacterium]|nr:hypothetical protein [Thermodesulfobacteriota bacterium]
MPNQIVQQIPSWSYWLPPVCLLTGVAITGALNYFNNKAIRDADEKKHLKELMLKTSVEYWKQDIERIKLSNKPALLLPIESYIFHILKLSDEINLNKEITVERIIEIRKEFNILSEKLQKESN